MAETIKIWYDPEGDYLEIILRNAPGYYEETELDQVMKKVDMEGRVIGLSILKVSSMKGTPFELSLAETA